MSAEKKLPAGWEVKRLGEVCELVNGGTPKTGVPEYWNGEHLWITPAEMGKRQTPYLSNTDRCLSDMGLRNSSAKLLPPYSVILSSRAPIGYLVINEKPMATNQGCKGIVPSDSVYYMFLYYFLAAKKDILNSLGTGATFKELSLGKLQKVIIPLPPLSEQKRIVAILDEAFQSIDRAKENAEKNLANAREVFDGYLNQVFSNPGKDWEEKKLGEIADVFDGPHATPKITNEGPLFLGIDSLVKGTIQVIRSRHVSEADYKIWTRRVTPQKDDVVFSYETRLGQAAIIPEGLICCLGRRVGLLRCDEKLMIPEFFLAQYLSPPYQNYLSTKVVKGATVDRLSITDFPHFYMKIPHVDEQKSIIKGISSLSAQTRHLESIYQKKLAALDELKKAILQKAFSGEL